MNVQEYILMPSARGQRNHDLFCAVLSAREQGWDEVEIRDAIAQKAARDGLSDYEIETTISSAMKKPVEKKDNVLSWNSKIGGNYKKKFFAWDDTIENEILSYPVTTIPRPRENWQQRDLIDFLGALYEPSEIVSYLTTFSQDKKTGQCKPAGRGVYVKTAQDLINELHDKNVFDVLFTDPECGAWIRLNPTDGKGIHDANVAAYKHALVEADTASIESQWETILRLKLPCSTVVHSGGKSLHAAVKIDAPDAKEYAKRVAKLYAVLEANGLKIDTQNKNPSRLSRMPGVTRNGNPQYLLAMNIGCATWEEWAAMVEQESDDMPLPESYSELKLNPPPLAPELIHGILRRGHKMLLGGPSKAGKSYALIQLAAAICGGGDWLGNKCVQGNVLYVNLEIDRASFVRRVMDVEHKIPFDTDRLTVWNLRGRMMSLDKLSCRLNNICRGKKFDMIILDPIYKTNVGDENSARDMTIFCNLIESISLQSGAAVCFAHHFSKGQQGAKASIDRSAGSGVFGRDPDSIGTLTELEMNDGEEQNGYLLEWTLREFRSPEPVSLRWKFPVHEVAFDLSDRKTIGAPGRPSSLNASKVIEHIKATGEHNTKNICNSLDVNISTLRRCVAKCSNLKIENGVIYVVD